MNFTSLFNTKRQSVRNSQFTTSKAFKRSLQLETLEERQLLTVAMDMGLDASGLNFGGTNATGVYSSPSQLQAELTVELSNAEEVNASEDTSDTLTQAKSDETIHIDSLETLTEDRTYTADGNTLTIKIGTNGGFDETNGTLYLKAINGGRIRMVKGDEVLYDSAWEFRGMNESIEINTTTDVTSGFSTTDKVISLREALDYAGTSYREYAEGKTWVKLSDTVKFKDEGAQFKLQSDLMVEDEDSEIVIDGSGLTMVLADGLESAGLVNLNLANMTIVNASETTMCLENVSFTGYCGVNAYGSDSDDTTEDYEVYGLVTNYGYMIMDNCEFKGIRMVWNLSGDYDNLNANIVGALVANMGGSLNVESSTFQYNAFSVNAVHGDVDSAFAAIYTEGYGAEESGLTTVYRSVIAENSIYAYSKHGDVTVASIGVLADNAQTVLFSTLIYGQDSTPDTKYGKEKSRENIGLLCSYEDTMIFNSTILDKIVLERSEAIVANTIYNETKFDRSGFYYNDGEKEEYTDADWSNYCMKNLTDWTAIFPYWDAENGTFTDNNYNVYADSVVVDKGDNSFITDEKGKVYDELSTDLLGNDRIINTTVDIGAVESDAVRLNKESLDPQATAQAGTDGLTTIDFSWGSDEIQSELVKYKVRYKLADETGNWTVIDTPFNMNSIPEGSNIVYDSKTMRYTWTVSGLTAGQTVYDFQVFAYGDRIDYLDSADWVATQEKTREQLKTPANIFVSPVSKSEISLTWTTDERSTAYEITYSDGETKTPLVVSEKDGVKITEVKIEGQPSIWSATYTLGNLNEQTTYIISLRSLATNSPNSYLLNSDVSASKECTTKGVLEQPVIKSTAVSKDTNALTIGWYNDDSNVTQYVVQWIQTPESTEEITEESWSQASSKTVKAKECSVAGLNADTSYTFRVKAQGNSLKFKDSAWSTPCAFTTLAKLADPTLNVGYDFTDEFETGTLQLSWALPEHATGYTLSMFDTATSTWNVLTNDPTVSTYTVDGLQASTPYQFMITAKGDDTYADSFVMKTQSTPTAVSTPVLTWTDNNDGTATVSWTAIDNAKSYIVNSTEPGITETSYKTGTVSTTDTTDVTVYARGDFDNNYASSGSDSISFKRLDATANVTATAKSTSSIEVTWDAVENASSYTVVYGTEGKINVTGTSVIINGLTNNTAYTFRVYANGGTVGDLNYLQSEANKDTASTWLKLTAPEVAEPTVAGKTITLNWSSPAGDKSLVKEYVWQYRTENGSWSENQVATQATATFTGLVDTTYEFRVMAISKDGADANSAWSETVSAETWEQLKIDDFSATTTGTRSVNVSWNEIKDVQDVTYSLLYTTGTPTQESTWTTINIPESALKEGVYNVAVEGLTPETTYTFSIKADATGYVQSETSLAYAKTNALAPITDNLTITATPKDQTITVNWDEVEKAGNYSIKYSWTPISGGEQQSVTVVCATPGQTLSNLEPGVAYSITVTAYPQTGDVEHKATDSNTVIAMTELAILPTPVGEATVVNNDINVTWNPVTNATGYNVWWYNNSTQKSGSVNLDKTTTSYQIADVTESTMYDIRVTALGDNQHYENSYALELHRQTLAKVDLDAAVVTTASKATGTKMPTSTDSVDEWTHSYMELWTGDVEGLVAGRTLTTSFELNKNFKIGEITDLPGTTVTATQEGTTVTVSIFIDSTYTGKTTNDSMVAQIELVPQSQDNGNPDQNGLKFDDTSKPGLVQFNGKSITSITPVVYDLNDDGKVNDVYDTQYYTIYAYTKPNSVDFNNCGMPCDSDYQMLTLNLGKSQAGDWEIDNTVIECECEPVVSSVALPTPTVVQTTFTKKEVVVQEDYQVAEVSNVEQAERMNNDVMPFANENNRMTSGIMLKKMVKDSDKKTEETAEKSTQAAIDVLDEILSAEDINWRYEA